MTSERTPQDVLREDAAWAVAATRITKEHGQLCPVWTQRMKRAEKPWQEAIAGCDCWIIKEARTTIRILEERGYRLDKAIAEAPASPPDHRLSDDPRWGLAPDTLSEKPGLDVALSALGELHWRVWDRVPIDEMHILDPDGFRFGKPEVVTWAEFQARRSECTLSSRKDAGWDWPDNPMDEFPLVAGVPVEGSGETEYGSTDSEGR